jgi:hypothetical protein
VPLSQLASFDFDQEFPLIWRRDRDPTLTVLADVAPGALPESIVATLAPAVAELSAGLPENYHIAVGGTVEESAQSQASVIAVVPLMLLLMITFLMIQLQSFSRLFLVLIIVPMAMTGVVAGLLLFQRPLGFVAILGILALIGMIARNGVILIEQIEAERGEGRPAWEAVIEASVSRFRPIMLTAVSTVLGLIPIAATIFWGPMAFAISGWLPGGHGRHTDIPTGALRGMVPHQGVACSWRRRGACRWRLTAGTCSPEQRRAPLASASSGWCSPGTALVICRPRPSLWPGRHLSACVCCRRADGACRRLARRGSRCAFRVRQ